MTSSPVLTIAHRGASAHAPENTLAAIRTAIDLRCDLVEVDVQRTRDGVLVLVHDTDVVRTTDAQRRLRRRSPWSVGDLTYDELLRLDAGSWFSPAYAGERIPTLDHALDLLAESSAGLLLEVKHPELYPDIAIDVATALRARPRYAEHAVSVGRLVVQSFDHQVMRAFAHLEPSIPVGLLGRPPVHQLPLLGTWARFVNPRHRRADEAYVDAIHAAGMSCLVWTVDREPGMHRALDLGVDGVISNRPDLLQRTLADRLVPA